ASRSSCAIFQVSPRVTRINGLDECGPDFARGSIVTALPGTDGLPSRTRVANASTVYSAGEVGIMAEQERGSQSSDHPTKRSFLVWFGLAHRASTPTTQRLRPKRSLS